MNKRALIISDQKKGHLHQSIALCEFLDLEYTLISTSFLSTFCRRISYLLDWLGIYTSRLFTLSNTKSLHQFSLIVCCGSTTYYPAKVLSKKHRIPVAALMYPSGYRNNFDWTICPNHDFAPKRKNTLSVPIAPTFFSEEDISQSLTLFNEMNKEKKEAYGFLIGGGCHDAEFDVDKLSFQLETLFNRKGDKQFWVATSPRTSLHIEALLKKYPFDRYFFYSQSPLNPMPALLHFCSRVFCTEDSVSMISTCVSQGKATIEVLESLKQKRSKIEEFIKHLEGTDCVHRYSGELGHAHNKLDIKDEIKAFMKDLYCKKAYK